MTADNFLGCQNCRHLVALHKHPGNTSPQLVGKMSEPTGLWVYTVFLDMGDHRAIAFESPGIGCELHESKEAPNA